MHKIYVYGTLRPAVSSPEQGIAKGWMYSLGGFPGVILPENEEDDAPYFVYDVREVDDLTAFDGYEGYLENDPENSLYIRKPFKDGWIYEYNREVSEDRLIESGDWLSVANPRHSMFM